MSSVEESHSSSSSRPPVPPHDVSHSSSASQEKDTDSLQSTTDTPESSVDSPQEQEDHESSESSSSDSESSSSSSSSSSDDECAGVKSARFLEPSEIITSTFGVSNPPSRLSSSGSNRYLHNGSPIHPQSIVPSPSPSASTSAPAPAPAPSASLPEPSSTSTSSSSSSSSSLLTKMKSMVDVLQLHGKVKKLKRYKRRDSVESLDWSVSYQTDSTTGESISDEASVSDSPDGMIPCTNILTRSTSSVSHPVCVAPMRRDSTSSEPDLHTSSARSANQTPKMLETRSLSILRSEEGHLMINQYVFVKKLGHGAFGRVVLVYDSQRDKFFAMKILNKQLLRKKRMFVGHQMIDGTKLAHREIAIQKKLNHRNIVKLHEVIDDQQNEQLFLVMDYVKGGAIMPNKPEVAPLETSQAHRHFCDLMMAIEYLHYQHVIHRDIKPANLLLSSSSRLKVADFGVSSVFDGVDDSMLSVAGSSAFMAPEVLKGETAYSGKLSDLWSCGVTLHMFIFGKCPFYDSNKDKLHDMIIDNPLSLPETAPESYHEEPTLLYSDLCDLLSGMLTKEPENRLRLDEILQHPWVTRRGTHVLKTLDKNCEVICDHITDEDVSGAVSEAQSNPFLVAMMLKLKMRSILKRLRKSAVLSESESSKDEKSRSQSRGIVNGVDPQEQEEKEDKTKQAMLLESKGKDASQDVCDDHKQEEKGRDEEQDDADNEMEEEARERQEDEEEEEAKNKPIEPQTPLKQEDKGERGRRGENTVTCENESQKEAYKREMQNWFYIGAFVVVVFAVLFWITSHRTTLSLPDAPFSSS